eukprot:TRINITY_DN10508_c0_g1_i1.p1 TRINITY_DN10508_c0_g1~~TRINITY_DN10508_c0_g1_i1.p1  ORF type:complete len:731 (-),score=252.70 TRINITY_DN10508_c0_g1_i1:1342-3315(-)
MEMKKQEQTILEERNQRMRMETAISGAVNKLSELEERMRRTEDSSKENKNALSQLISHTKNVERAVTMSQQDMLTKKEQQGTKIQELYHKLATVQQNRETLERTCYVIRDDVRELEGKMDNLGLEVKDFEGAVKMQSAMMEKLSAARVSDPEGSKKENKMTETQRAMLEAKIMQCQQATLDISSKLSAEKRDRDSDFDQVNSRITEVVADLSERDRRRESEQREQEAKNREQTTVGSAEKQKIIMQISAVQTDIKRNLEERDSKLKEMTLHKLDEMDKKLAEAEKSKSQGERDIRTFVESEVEKQKVYVDHGVDSVRKMQESESEKMRQRLAELSDNLNQIESGIAEVKSNVSADLQKVMQEADSREKILEAKIDDQGDKLRLGMGTLQAAIGEGRQGGGSGPDDDRGDAVPLEEVEQMQAEAMDGLREGIAKQIAEVEEDISVMKSDIQRQGDIIEARLKSHQQAGEDASNILGDKLHQKMDSIAFTQERMKRQMDDLQDKIAGAPTDIGDLRDRIDDIERDVSKNAGGGGGGGANSEDLEAMRKDLDKILGRDEAGTAEIDGIPTLTRLQTDIDQLNANVNTLGGGVEELKNQVTDKIKEEKEAREEETSSLKKDLERLEKKSKELKERVKGKLGVSLPDDDDDVAAPDEEEKNE